MDVSIAKQYYYLKKVYGLIKLQCQEWKSNKVWTTWIEFIY